MEGKWRELIQQLRGNLASNSHHQLFKPLRLCVHLLNPQSLEGYLDCNFSTFAEDLNLLLSVCKQLDDVAHEYHFREELASNILIPLMKSLQQQEASVHHKTVENFIRHYLPFNTFGAISHSPLCDHKARIFKEIIKSNDANPSEFLIVLHARYISFLQENAEQYEEAALVIRVLDYWRMLKTASYKDFEDSDIRPLLTLGENILVLAQKTQQPLKSQELWRLVLLIQLLLHDHPGVEDLLPAKWPYKGFVISLIGMREDIPRQSRNDLQSSPLLKDCRPELVGSRAIFQESNDILTAQYKHSQSIIELLRDMVLSVSQVLGNPPCDIAVCVLGSTSRYDRRPYSDVELMILHSEPSKFLTNESLEKWQAQVTVYVHHVMSLLELMIVRLGETHHLTVGGNAGFHVDSSCHVLTKKAWGTPADVLKRLITEQPANEENQVHPWLDSESLYALLQPVLIHPGKLGADELLQAYQHQLQDYLQARISAADQMSIINQRFKVERSFPWFDQLTRQQGIALSCLRDVVERSESEIQSQRPGQTVDIKQVYYKPLAYTAMNLRLYFDWTHASPLEIMRRYTKELSWAGEEILAWWQSALAFVSHHQISLHFENGHQEEEIVYPDKWGQSELRLWSGLDLIYQGFIKPLKEILNQSFAGQKNAISNMGYAVLQAYLNARQSWLKRWTKPGIDPRILLTHPLIQVLAQYPDKQGWSPGMTLSLQSHIEALNGLVMVDKSACQLSGLPIGKGLFLPNQLVQECFNDKGKFQGESEISGRDSQVRKLSWDGREWYLKVKQGNKEGLMGREYTVMMLHLLLGGKPQVALGWPIKLMYAQKGRVKNYYAWISEAIAGESLGSVMLKAPDRLSQEQMDPISFGQLFLLSFLCCPEDGQPENFKVQQTHSGKTRLIAIDYGQCFVQAESMQKARGRSSTQVLTLKTMIYLMGAMDGVLAPELITRLRLLDINAWFSQWKSAIDSINALFKPLLENDLAAASVPKADYEKHNRLVDVDDGVLGCIKMRLELLQHWLRTKSTTEPITGSSVLKSLEPLVAMQYQSLRPKIKTPNDFYTKLDIKAYVKDRKSGKMVSSATFASIQQQTITPEQLQRSCDLDPKYFRHVNFHQLDDKQQQFTLGLLEATAKAKGQDFRYLNLSGCRMIDKDGLIKLLELMPVLEDLDIRDCKQFNKMTVFYVVAHGSYVGSFVGASSSDFRVLCPLLKRVKLLVDGDKYELKINLALAQRQQLTIKARQFIQFNESVVDRLVKVLKNRESYRVWESTAKSLRQLGHWDLQIQTNLLAALSGDKNYNVRVAAATALGNLGQGHSDIRAGLLKAMRDEEWPVRDSAVEALGRLGLWDSEIRAVFLKVLEDETNNSCDSVVKAIGQLGQWDPEIRAGFLRLWPLHRSAPEVLAQLGRGDPEVRTSLLAGLRNDDVPVRAAAAEALGHLGHWDSEIRECFLVVLGDPKEVVRFAVAWALGQLGHWDSEIQAALLKALKDEPHELRLSATKAIGQLGHWDPEIRAGLLQAMRDKDWSVRHSAVEALGILGQRDSEIRAVLLRALEAGMHQSATKAIGQLGQWDPEIRAGLLKIILRGEDLWETQVSAAETLGQLGRGDPELRASLLAALTNEDRNVRVAAAKGLGHLGDSDLEIRACLLVALTDPDEFVRCSVAEALGQLGLWDPEIRSGLLKMLLKRGSLYQRLGTEVSRIRTSGGDNLTNLWHRMSSEPLSAIKALEQLSRYWDVDIQRGLVRALGNKYPELSDAVAPVLGQYLRPSACINHLVHIIQSLSTNDATNLNEPDDDKITKRIFFFVTDPQTQRALPCVSRKWRDLYEEFQEDQRLEAAPELQSMVDSPKVDTQESHVLSDSLFGFRG